jgi:AcrR family transcriptional regulator
LASKQSRKKLDVDDLLTGVLSHLLKNNPYKLTYSKVSKLTGVPRPTLYYYFGNSPKNLLSEAVKFGMKQFVRLHSLEKPSDHADWESFQRARLRDVINLVRRRPWAPALYFQYRMNAFEWGDAMQDVEKDYIQKFSAAWKRYFGYLPDERAVRMSGYVKLGLLFGLALDADIWLKPENKKTVDELIEKFSELATQLVALKFEHSPSRDDAPEA